MLGLSQETAKPTEVGLLILSPQPSLLSLSVSYSQIISNAQDSVSSMRAASQTQGGLEDFTGLPE